MLEAILRAAGLDAVACGNIGYPVVDAVRAGRRVLAVELSSFQLHWSPSVVPAAGCVLNVAEDHLDWHGSMAAYAAAKARALRGPVAVAGVDDPPAAALLAASPAARRVGVTLGEPGPGQLGIVGGALVDRAFRRVRRSERGVGAEPRRVATRADGSRRRAAPPGLDRRAGRRRAGPRRRRGARTRGRRARRVPAGPAPRGPGRDRRRRALRRRLEGDEPARGGGVAGCAGARPGGLGGGRTAQGGVGRRAGRRARGRPARRRW